MNKLLITTREMPKLLGWDTITTEASQKWAPLEETKTWTSIVLLDVLGFMHYHKARAIIKDAMAHVVNGGTLIFGALNIRRLCDSEDVTPDFVRNRNLFSFLKPQDVLSTIRCELDSIACSCTATTTPLAEMLSDEESYYYDCFVVFQKQGIQTVEQTSASLTKETTSPWFEFTGNAKNVLVITDNIDIAEKWHTRIRTTPLSQLQEYTVWTSSATVFEKATVPVVELPLTDPLCHFARLGKLLDVMPKLDLVIYDGPPQMFVQQSLFNEVWKKLGAGGRFIFQDLSRCQVEDANLRQSYGICEDNSNNTATLVLELQAQGKLNSLYIGPADSAYIERTVGQVVFVGEQVHLVKERE